MRLKNRVAMVTGGSSGIGRGIALAFAREGARVVIADLREEPLRGKYHEQDVRTPTAVEIERNGGEALFVQTDVADPPSQAALFEAALRRFGGLDILVNNAGIHIPGSSQTLSLEDWDRVVGLNLRGAFLAAKLAIPHLRNSPAGRIIHIASIHAHGGGAGPAYAPAKAALVNLARDTALELGPYGVTVNAICPGYIETPIQDYLTPEQIEACRQRTPLPRLGRPSDIANACVFLASEEAEWITGASLTIDGGYSAHV
ncbi:MAG: SDR family NAD(P)-dependent oxidoreductase [Actinomycetota bacterium]